MIILVDAETFLFYLYVLVGLFSSDFFLSEVLGGDLS
jgi:hypothetical protein